MTDDILTTMELILNKVDVSLMATSAFCLHIFVSSTDFKTSSCLKSYISIIQKSVNLRSVCVIITFGIFTVPLVSYSAKLSLSSLLYCQACSL